MIHLTVETGHTRMSPRSEVSDEAVAFLRGALWPPAAEPPDSIAVPGAPGYRLGVAPGGEGLWAAVWHERDGVRAGGQWMGDAICVWVVVSTVEAALTWPRIQARNKCAQPDSVPWLAVSLAPLAVQHPDALEWLGDLERCVAWAWLEERDA